MKYALPVFAVTAALVAPTIAEARQVTFSTTLKDYGGANAYIAIYLTSAAGKYQNTFLLVGGKARYFRTLSDWYRASGGGRGGVDGITGASIGAGQTLRVSADVADALIDAGYQIHVDTSSENGMENPSEVVVPLSTKAAGKPVSGSGYVQSFTVSF